MGEASSGPCWSNEFNYCLSVSLNPMTVRNVLSPTKLQWPTVTSENFYSPIMTVKVKRRVGDMLDSEWVDASLTSYHSIYVYCRLNYGKYRGNFYYAISSKHVGYSLCFWKFIFSGKCFLFSMYKLLLHPSQLSIYNFLF